MNVIDMFYMVGETAKQKVPASDPLKSVRHPLNSISHPLKSVSHPLKSVSHPLNGYNVSSLARIRALQELLDQYFPRN